MWKAVVNGVFGAALRQYVTGSEAGHATFMTTQTHQSPLYCDSPVLGSPVRSLVGRQTVSVQVRVKSRNRRSFWITGTVTSVSFR